MLGTPTHTHTHSERDALYERLSNLEDESAAVKVSLIQLLQEKSATNKTLALENWRLSQRVSCCVTFGPPPVSPEFEQGVLSPYFSFSLSLRSSQLLPGVGRRMEMVTM